MASSASYAADHVPYGVPASASLENRGSEVTSVTQKSGMVRSVTGPPRSTSAIISGALPPANVSTTQPSSPSHTE